MVKYTKILKERERIMNEMTEEMNFEGSERLHDIDHFFECETYKTYEKIKEFMHKEGFTRIYDIGCAYGIQSEVFDDNIEYVGINETGIGFWNDDKFKYITKRYPFEIHSRITDLAVSVLCLTWNCYLYDSETLHEQCSALTRDFDNVMLYMAKDKIEIVSSYFKGHEIIEDKLVYFYN